MSKQEQRAETVRGQTAPGNRRSDFLSDVVEHAPDAVFVFEGRADEPERWHMVYANAAFESMYGLTRSEAVGKDVEVHLAKRIPSEDLARTIAGIKRRAPFRIVHRRADSQEPMWCEVHFRPKREPERDLWFAVSRDVTETIVTQHRSRHLRRALDEAQEAIAVSTARDEQWYFEYVNHAFTELLGYTANELSGRGWRSLFARESDLKQLSDYRVGLLTGQRVRGDILMRRKDGSVAVLYVSATPFSGEDEAMWAVTTLRDVTEVRREERQLREQASLDPLTDLQNRREFERLLQTAIEMTPIGERAHVVMFIDLDGFKRINDTEGHDAGDRVLIAVAQTLRRTLLPSDEVARWGGDEFAAILYFCAPDQAAMRGRDLIRALGSNLECRGVGASIGIVRITAGAALSRLMHDADRLVYEAKAAGRNRVMIEA